MQIGTYIIDIVARIERLAMEVDGDTHATRIGYDRRRTAWLKSIGYRVLRFANADVMGNTEGVAKMIRAELAKSPSPQLSPCGGEGEI